jgi:hypothetical protein
VTGPSADGASRAHSSGLDIFRNPSYRRLWASGCFVYVARWVDLVALGWLALALTGSPFMVGLATLGFVEAAFAATQSTVVLLSAPEGVRGGTVGILSACVGTQPVGTLAIGALVGIAGVSLAFTINALSALIVTVPLALWLFRR